MKSNRKRIIVTLTALFLMVSGTAYGQLGEGLIRFGPTATGPVGTFPAWYMDSTGLALEGCLDGSAFCLLSTPADLQVGGVGEAFYWMATSDMGVAGALFELALEMAFLNANPAVLADAQVFNRIRIRIRGLPAGGAHTVTHPFGELVVDAVDDGQGAFEINFTDDFAGGGAGPASFQQVLGAPYVGPFLVSTAPPAGGAYIGNPDVLSTVTGGVNGNSVSIAGPGANGSSDLFGIVGKRATNGGLSGVRATFARDAAGTRTVTVRASSIGGQNITARFGPKPPARPKFKQTLVADTAPGAPVGSYTATVNFGTAGVISPVKVKNTTDASKPGVSVPVVDVVTITQATFNPTGGVNGNGVLTVAANSSDQLAPGPTLQVIDIGSGAVLRSRVGSTMTVNIPTNGVQPTKIRVVSSSGGKRNADVTVPPPPAP